MFDAIREGLVKGKITADLNSSKTKVSPAASALFAALSSPTKNYLNIQEFLTKTTQFVAFCNDRLDIRTNPFQTEVTGRQQ